MNYKYYQKKVKLRQIDGTFKRKTIYGKTKKELSQKVNNAIEQSEKAYQDTLMPYFETVADEWYNNHTLSLSVYTAQCYIAPMKDLIARFGDTKINEITPIDIQNLLNDMYNQGYAKQTIKLRLITANLIYQYAILKGYIPNNPTQAVKVPKNAVETKRTLPSNEDIKKILSSVDKPFGLYAYLIYYTGCRREEALALSYEDIDFNNNIININKKLILYPQPHIEQGTKTGKPRTIPLLEPLKSALTKKHGLLFPDDNGKYLSKWQFDKKYAKYKRDTGITATSHQLRHAYATLCYDAGLQDKDTAEVMGHAKIETTKNIYTHIREERKKAIQDQLNKYVS